MKNISWVGYIIGITTGVMLSDLTGKSGLNLNSSLPHLLFPILTLLLGLALIFYIVYKFIIRRDKFRSNMDERVQSLEDKSARNGFVATFLAIFGVLLYRDNSGSNIILGPEPLMVIILAGFAVFLFSLIFYLYVKDRI